MSETRKVFSANLARLIDEREIEQQKLAADLKVSPSIVSSWVLGKRFPRANKMQEIADYFHVTVADLVEQTPSPVTRPKLAVLFSRSRALTDKQLDIVNSLVDEMIGERDGFTE